MNASIRLCILRNKIRHMSQNNRMNMNDHILLDTHTYIHNHIP